MRLSEVVGLKDSQVDSSNRLFKVLGKGNKERLIPVGGDLLSEILSYQKDRDERFKSEGRLLVTEIGLIFPVFALRNLPAFCPHQNVPIGC